MNYENITPIKRAALSIVDKLKEQILNDCSDEEVADSLIKFNPETHGYVREDQFMTADEAMRTLKIKSRNKFFALTKLYGIKNNKISNQNVGFLVTDINKLHSKIRKK